MWIKATLMEDFFMNLKDKILKAKQGQSAGNMVQIDDVQCIYLGAKTTKHFKKDDNGSKTKEQEGWKMYFSELGTSNVVTCVTRTNLETPPKLVDGELYLVSGLGYKFTVSKGIFIDKLSKFEVIKD